MAYNFFPYICHVSCTLIINPVPKFYREHINNCSIFIGKPDKKINREITITYLHRMGTHLPSYDIPSIINPPMGGLF